MLSGASKPQGSCMFSTEGSERISCLQMTAWVWFNRKPQENRCKCHLSFIPDPSWRVLEKAASSDLGAGMWLLRKGLVSVVSVILTIVWLENLWPATVKLFDLWGRWPEGRKVENCLDLVLPCGKFMEFLYNRPGESTQGLDITVSGWQDFTCCKVLQWALSFVRHESGACWFYYLTRNGRSQNCFKDMIRLS